MTAWLIALGLGLQITLLDCLVLVPLISLATTLPVSLGGWGMREGAAISLLALIGIDNAHALALSLLLGLTAVVAALPGSLLWFVSRRSAHNVSL